MKRVLSDKNVPRPLLRLLTAFVIETAVERGWDEIENGELLGAAEEAGFDVLLTADKSMQNEQRFAGRLIGTVVLTTNDWRIVRHHVTAIGEAIHKCKPSQVLAVECGGFSRRRKREPHYR